MPVTFTIGNQSAQAVTDSSGLAETTVPLRLPPGTYSVSAAVTSTDGLIPSSAAAAEPITVTKEPTLLTLAPTGGTQPPGLTCFTATLWKACTSCGRGGCPARGPPP